MNKDIIKTNADNNSLKGMFMQCAFAGVFGIILAFVLLCIISIFLFANPMAVETVTLIGMLSKYFCAIVVAFIACAKRQTKGYIRGLVSVLIFVLVGGLFFSLFSISGLCGNALLYDILVCSILGVISGAFAVNLNSRHRK